jgi:hypothetical protein
MHRFTMIDSGRLALRVNATRASVRSCRVAMIKVHKLRRP